MQKITPVSAMRKAKPQLDLLDFTEERKIVKNPIVFDLRYVPPVEYFYIREELKTIDENFKRFLKFGLQSNMFIYGNAGTGKTATIKIFERISKEKGFDVKFLYVSGRECKSKSKIISALTGQPYKKADVSILTRKLRGMNVIIIDDANMIPPKNLNDICFIFSRWGELNKVNSQISVILISNKFNLNVLLGAERGDPTLSSLQPENIFFNPYTERELFNILELRATEGLVEGSWDEDLLREIARKCANEYFGDARYAILALGKAAVECENAGKSKIEVENIDNLFTSARDKLDRYTIHKLDLQSVVILYSALISESKTIDDVYLAYVDVCKKYDFSVVKKRAFYDYLYNLHNLGIVSFHELRYGRGRPKLCIQVCIAEDAVVERFRSLTTSLVPSNESAKTRCEDG